jgi:hypothetical protein
MNPESGPAPSVRIFNFRHSIAGYKAYGEKLSSDEPSGSLDINNQPRSDLTEAGIEHAKASADKFLDTMDPAKDVFYVVASTQTRAIETAKIYADRALARGFTVVNHGAKTGSTFAGILGEGYVRSLDNLSLKDNALHVSAFYPVGKMPQINWDAVDPDTKEKLEEVRSRTVEQKDYGSWGANMYHYAAEVKKVFPDVQTPEELYQSRFGNLVKLAGFAHKKAAGQQVNVLSFGHENYMGVPLERDTGNHVLGNCEALELKDGKLTRLSL